MPTTTVTVKVIARPKRDMSALHSRRFHAERTKDDVGGGITPEEVEEFFPNTEPTDKVLLVRTTTTTVERSGHRGGVLDKNTVEEVLAEVEVADVHLLVGSLTRSALAAIEAV